MQPCERGNVAVIAAVNPLDQTRKQKGRAMKQARKAISEIASENPAHRKRGRRAVYSEQQMNLARQYSDASTVRGKQNFLYMTRAIRVLDYDPEFCWLVGTPEEINAGKKVFHNTILT